MQMEFNDDGSLKVKEKVPKKLLSQPHIKVLKLIKELSFPVGRKLMAEVLRGEENTRIKQFKLNYKNNFGTLGLYDTKDVYELLDTMLSKNLIEIIKSGVNFYPVIKMTPKGQQQLENPTDIEEQYCIEQDNLCQITEDDKKIFEAFGDFLKGYNPEQKKAIIEQGKSILCIAGAGTGKTTVLTKRIEYLAKLKAVPTEKILAITFTRKARQEMIRRLEKLIPGHKVKVETFNSFCEKLLRRHSDIAYEKEYEVIDFKTKIQLVNEALEKMDYTLDFALDAYFHSKSRNYDKQEKFFEFLRDVFSIIDHYENNEKPIEEFGKIIKKLARGEDKQTSYFIYNLIKEINQLKQEKGVRDYTDQIVHVLRLFKSNPELIPRFNHVLVDEYQDVNRIQVKLLNKLKPKNLFVVGDPRQSIYGWRGSKIRYILNFTRDHEGSSVIQLTKNYRSGKDIVNMGNKVIKTMNLPDLEPMIESEKPIVMIKHNSENSESLFIAQSILSQQIQRDEIFILARTNKQLDNIAHVLGQHNIKFLKRTIDDEKQDIMPKEDEITLSTVHAIKGLEAELIYMIGVNSQMYPCMVSDHPVLELAKTDEYYDKHDEELRLLYVGLTRAKKQLVVSYYSTLSRFITDEIKNTLTENVNTAYTKQNPDDIITKLRDWRTEISERERIPPYIVFPDKTMLELANTMPTSLEELKYVHGFGPSKIARYGNQIIELLS